ncbi:MAG TPA: hypothetical protein VNX21_01390 [Candidatus Thermoplasmatota archaeon]|nr:hypothetical protein [Candidatus Thermoplasmatota archaeon]
MGALPNSLVRGYLIILRLLLRTLRRLAGAFEPLAERIVGERGPRRDVQERCCIDLPPHIRARPDPYIYSQEWLRQRGLAYVWDNPDFRLLAVPGGAPADHHDLKPDTDYDVEVTVHNGSLMGAINTEVRLEVLNFGAGTAVVADLGVRHVDVPGAGSSKAVFRWRTPPEGGHRCLRATLQHHDDANPLNNVGQHNTDVARPASPTRKLRFLVGNHGTAPKAYRFEMDAYQLPKQPQCAATFEERGSEAHLRRLQKANDPAAFPVPPYLQARLTRDRVALEPGQEVEVALEMNPPPRGTGRHAVNVHVLDGTRLVGGVTAYVLEEGK